MPKRKIFGEIVNRVVDWQAVDAREEADGEVEEVQRLAEVSHCSFIDGRVTERLTCSDCTSEIDLTEYFRTRMISAVSFVYTASGCTLLRPLSAAMRNPSAKVG